MNWKPELDELARREAFAREMGGVDKVKRQRDRAGLPSANVSTDWSMPVASTRSAPSLALANMTSKAN